MKHLLLSVLMPLVAAPAFATIDGHARVYLVVQNIQDSDEFFIERVPVIGCYGLSQGPQLAQFTAEYKVKSSIGCGEAVNTSLENLNYLTCAKVVDSKESADFSGFGEITLDISQCEAKNNPKFITMVRTAAKLNFPQKKGEVRLNLIK